MIDLGKAVLERVYSKMIRLKRLQLQEARSKFYISQYAASIASSTCISVFFLQQPKASPAAGKG